MFWDDADSEEKKKKTKGKIEKGESIDDIKRPEEKKEEARKEDKRKDDRKKEDRRKEEAKKEDKIKKDRQNENLRKEEARKDKKASSAAPKEDPPSKGGFFGFFGGSGENAPSNDKQQPSKDDKQVPKDDKQPSKDDKQQATEDNEQQTDNKKSSKDNEQQKDESKNSQEKDKESQSGKTVYSDKNPDEDPEYNFVASKEDEKKNDEFLFGIIRLIASAPVVVSFLSLSHIIRKIPVKYLMIGCAIAPIHFILSLLMISDMSKDDRSKDVAYTSITSSSCPPLSIIVDVYLFVMKFLTCIFMVDMFLESIYAIFPDLRLDEFSLGVPKIFFLVMISLFLVILVLTYKSLPIALHALNILVIVAAVLLLICLSIYSKLDVKQFVNASSGNSPISLSDVLFLGFSFISFSCECQSISVMVFKKGRSTALLISLISVVSIFVFLMLLIYFGDWILQKNLSETLNIILPSFSDLNRSLRDSKTDSYNLLSRVSFLSCLVISLIGFILQVNILSRSLISVFSFLKRASDFVGLIVTFILVLSLVVLVVAKDIGRMLWMTTRILFFGFPLYAMYPYLAELTNENSSKVYFIFAILGLLCLCFFVYLSFYDVSILSPSKI